MWPFWPLCSAELLCHLQLHDGTSQAESFPSATPTSTSHQPQAEQLHENSASHFYSGHQLATIANHLHLLSLSLLFGHSRAALMGIWHTLAVQACWENGFQAFQRGFQGLWAVHGSRGSPSLPTVKHVLPENFALGVEKQKVQWPDKKFNNVSLGLGCSNLMQDGNPGWTRLGSSPSPLSLHHSRSPSVYSGVTSPKRKLSAAVLSKLQSLPLLPLHLNYSLLCR